MTLQKSLSFSLIFWKILKVTCKKSDIFNFNLDQNVSLASKTIKRAFQITICEIKLFANDIYGRN